MKMMKAVPKNATTKALNALGATLNFIDIWLKLFVENYDAGCVAYITAMKEMFKQIPQTMIKSLTPKQKVQKLTTNIGGRWYTGKSAKGLPTLKRSKISKKSQYNQDKIKKKLYEAYKWWNDWIFQLHWNNLEWVDPKYIIKRDKPYSVSSKCFT